MLDVKMSPRAFGSSASTTLDVVPLNADSLKEKNDPSEFCTRAYGTVITRSCNTPYTVSDMIVADATAMKCSVRRQSEKIKSRRCVDAACASYGSSTSLALGASSA